MITYLDNSATTQPCPEAVAAITEALEEDWGNPSSQHELGRRAEHLLEDARRSAAEALGAQPERVFFTSGGTEADNWAVFGAARRMAHRRARRIVTTAVEHDAVLNPVRELERQGCPVTYLAPDETGLVSPDALRGALGPDVGLVSVMMVNNESGAVMPIAEMVRAVRRACPDALFHTDAVQGFLKVPFRASSLGADLISVSGHKIHASKGVGALWIRPGLTLPPLLYGGGQEKALRSGTENLPAIAGFGAACAAAYPGLREELAEMTRLRDLARERLAAIPGCVLLARGDAPHIVPLSVPGVRSQGLINCLQDEGVYVSAGSACSKGRRSHVLTAMGLPNDVVDGAIRVSLSRFTTEADVGRLAAAMAKAVAELKK